MSVVKTEFIFSCVNKESPPNLRDKVSTVQTVQKVILKRVTILEGRNILQHYLQQYLQKYLQHCTIISPIYTFPWRET